MCTVEAIAFFKAFVAGSFELIPGLRRERWGGVGWGQGRVGWDRSEITCMSSTRWDSCHESTRRSVLCETWFVFGQHFGCALTHAPALQRPGEMMTRVKRNGIQKRDAKRICPCLCIVLVGCVCVRLSTGMWDRTSRIYCARLSWKRSMHMDGCTAMAVSRQ